jgi:hypothetical protein
MLHVRNFVVRYSIPLRFCLLGKQDIHLVLDRIDYIPRTRYEPQLQQSRASQDSVRRPKLRCFFERKRRNRIEQLAFMEGAGDAVREGDPERWSSVVDVVVWVQRGIGDLVPS